MVLLVVGQTITPPTQVFVADMPIVQLNGSDEYFDRLGWGELPQVSHNHYLLGEVAEYGGIDVAHVDSRENDADMLTQPLSTHMSRVR